MNLLDIIILGLLTFFIIKGVFRGFFREVSSLAGIIAGLLIGNHYHPLMGNLLKAYIPLEGSLPVLSFVFLFILVFAFFNLSGILLHHLFQKLFIGWFDRGLGVLFAMFKGVIVSYLLIVLLTFFMPSQSPLIARSTAAHWVIVTYQSISRLISPDFYRIWTKKISEETQELGKIIVEGKEAVQKIPQVLPDKKQ